ncbi:chemotaxis protein CheD [Gracilibacillus sp. YIM 98692]|uniref:chemotaxis protein CheD n=1 Tax=Gracilibacillus sp. YIM 98692 TaxID=2663532 RepID=UPI0013D65374|nr:chemotaxis protein CheD [Gracilibacillus sp. YIM 98692]
MTSTKTMIKVGIADVKVAQSLSILKTAGLGSCVGIVLYDEDKELAGLAHIMLPDSKASKNNKNVFKYADTAIDWLLEELLSKGSRRDALKAKMAGGAHMFSFKSNELMKIGERNIKSVHSKLLDYQIPLLSEDVGGSKGRTIEFDIETSMLHIKTINGVEKVI